MFINIGTGIHKKISWHLSLKDYLMKKKLMLINLDLLKDLMSLRFVFRVFVLKLLLSVFSLSASYILSTILTTYSW